MKILGGMTRERDRQREESEDSSRQDIMVTTSLLLGSQCKAYDVYVLFGLYSNFNYVNYPKLIYTHLP